MAGRARMQEVKVVLLGDMGVGKSSIALRLVHDQFNANSVTTVGAVCWTKSVNTTAGPIKLQLWDTAGQERYHALAPLYYRGAAVAVVVYDITRRETFGTLKDWVRELKMQGPSNILIAVVGNKADLVENRQVEESAGKEFANEINGLFAETSAKDAEGGINELFTRIGENLPVLPTSEPSPASNVSLDNKSQSVSGAQKGGCKC
eukprot:TRINITY_DN18057_c0_g2_i1.p1 TRINITY_DN18057_c0_g2~~TRINITY_DN18057_c0_g2_i1.p1  ORF type:complete len:205 (-),score=35.07 TRINITY_DN18057_c0_g2_i1:349-963(-)